MANDEQQLNQIEAIVDKVSSQDGYFFISESEDGVFLTVFPPHGTGMPVSKATVLENLASRQIKGYDTDLIEATLAEAPGLPIKIAAATAILNQVQAEPRIDISLSLDKMEAEIEIEVAHAGEVLHMDTVLEKIQQANIRFGIDQKALEEACASPGRRVIFARGIRPQNGRDAYISYLVDVEKKAQPKELDDGRVDFKDLGILTQVSQNDLIVEKIPAAAGKPGIDLWGRRIEGRHGKDIMLPTGKNVKLVDCSKMLAAIDGQVTLENEKICVIPVIEVDGDVDLSTGNIDFKGNIIIKGSVQSGFSVKAGGDVEIGGTISGGTVEARNITVKQGIVGGKDSIVQAEEDVFATFVQNAKIVAGRDIKIKNVIINSNLNSGHFVWATGDNGAILGGNICAGEEIFAINIGTDISGNTDLRVGVNPVLREEYQKLKVDLKKVEEDLDKMGKTTKFLRSIARQQLSTEKQKNLLQLTQAEFHLRGQKENIHKRISEIEEALENMRFGRIKVKECLAAGTKVMIGALRKPIRTDVKFVKLFVDQGDIQITSFH
ncbi:MAG: FapA family protein [Pelosinus sp.]|nr:FapA family protein [Pelosinus sp.]